MGTWRLNRDQSDSPHAQAKQRTDDSQNNPNHGGYGGPRMGGTWPGGMGGPGMGGGGMGGHGGPGGHQGESTEKHNRALDALHPGDEITLTQRLEKDPEIDLADDREHRQAFFTDGRKLMNAKDSSYEQIAAHWDGNKLITDEKGPHGGKMTRTFELSPDGMQLLETIQIASGKNNDKTSTIRYVYDAAAPESSQLGAK